MFFERSNVIPPPEKFVGVISFVFILLYIFGTTTHLTVSKVTELETTLTSLLRRGAEADYTEAEIDELPENIDLHTLPQAVWNNAETVYA